jgi:tyrosyl-tRNA synthetase
MEVTTLLHGAEAAEAADAASQALFGGSRSLDDPSIPTTTVPLSEVDAGMTIAEAFVRAGLCASRGEARRLAQQGGLSIDDERIEQVDTPLAAERGSHLLRVGKKRFMRLTIE